VASQNSEFADSLARGEDVFIQTHFAVRLAPKEVQAEDWARWRELTGSELGEDVYMVGTTFTHEVILPRQVLHNIWKALLKKRAEFPEPPFPWLFRPKPYYVTPTEGEEELVCQLEKRVVALKMKKRLCSEQTEKSVAEYAAIQKTLWRDLEAAGLFSTTYSKQKQLWLEKWDCTSLQFYYRETMKLIKQFRQVLSLEASPMQDLSISIRAPEHAPHFILRPQGKSSIRERAHA
jgi:hypothetical protein